MTAAPIRGLRAMAIVRWLMLLLVAAVAAGTWLRLSHDDHGVSAGEADPYACPMHPQIRSSGPGSCPICGMNLEPIAAEVAPSSAPALPEPGAAPEGLSSIMISSERRQLASIVTTAAEERDVARELRMPALLDVPKSAIAEARVRVPAYIEGVAPIEVGDRVKAGQMLAWATAPDIARGVEELRAVDKGRKGGDDPLGDRLSEAAKRKLALFGVAGKQAEAIAASTAPAGSIAIGAPIGGVVTARRAVRGGYAGPEDALFEITDYAKLWARATLSTEDASSLTTTTPASLWIGGERLDAHFALIEPLAAPETRTASARFVIDNAGLRLRPGTVGEVVADLGVERHLVVPRDAVVETGTTSYVFVERPNGVFEPRVVAVGPLFRADRAVLRGLAVGERVVSRGAFVLDSESRLHAAHTSTTSKVQP